jgi:lipid A 4'-phosphatase
MPTDRLLAALVLALIGAGVLFALWPGLDLAATRFVYDHGGLWGSPAVWRARDILRVAPFWLLGLLAALWVARWWRWPGLAAPSGSAMIFLIAGLILGPGLIVNLGLKAHSHRPRPVHVTEFGGDEAFRPWDRFDGACKRNCSFASGEAASGFWTLAPALLVPPPLRAVAVAAAILYGFSTSALRVLVGGHFLSDVLFGGLISSLVVVALWRLYEKRRL